jgi:type I restriction enzyme M protein
MVSKFERVEPDKHKHGSRLAIVFSGSPLFTGGAGSGESEIRKWIIENDWLDAIIALPEAMFYNTGIGTYIWIVTNRKDMRRKSKIQLIDAREFYIPMSRSQGDKRRKIGEGKDAEPPEPDQIAEVVKLYGKFAPNERSIIFDNADFGYTRVTVERPLRLAFEVTKERKAGFLQLRPELNEDLAAIEAEFAQGIELDWNYVWETVKGVLRDQGSRWKASDQKLFRAAFTQRDPRAEPVKIGQRDDEYEPDSVLRDFENVPLKEDVLEYFRREVAPHVPDAWMDRSKDKVGYEINFNRHFYKFVPPRVLEEIDADIKRAEEAIVRLLGEVTA